MLVRLMKKPVPYKRRLRVNRGGLDRVSLALDAWRLAAPGKMDEWDFFKTCEIPPLKLVLIIMLQRKRQNEKERAAIQYSGRRLNKKQNKTHRIGRPRFTFDPALFLFCNKVFSKLREELRCQNVTQMCPKTMLRLVKSKKKKGPATTRPLGYLSHVLFISLFWRIFL